MANPQTENGYTPIANELLEAIYSTRFNATQFKILLFIMRYTYGFSRKEYKFSLSFISKGTGISKRYVSVELQKLINANVVTLVKKHTDTEARVLKFNKDYESWNSIVKKLPQVKNSSTGEELIYTTGEELFYTTGEELFYQDNQNINQNINQNTKSGFITPPLKDLKKKIKDLITDIKELKKKKITHGKFKGVHPAFKVVETFSMLPEEDKVGALVEAFLSLFPQKNVKHVAAAANANDIFTKTLNLPLCNGPEDILKEIVYYEGNSYTPWDVQKVFKKQKVFNESFARMRYELDKARKE